MTRKQNSDVLLETLDLKGRRVIDVGSGEGALTRLLARQGARVTGVECSPEQLEKARAEPRVADETFVEGVAENLPFPAGTADVVIFFNSLHHVRPVGQAAALAEAARVLKPGGTLYVSEPIAEGPHFELLKPIDDETEVRAAAYAVVKRAAEWGLKEERETTHVHMVRYRSFEAFRDRMLGPNPERTGAFRRHDAGLRDAFERLAEREGDAYLFAQPTRVNLLRKT
jgi:SAM-dependent methyltransferase